MTDQNPEPTRFARLEVLSKTILLAIQQQQGQINDLGKGQLSFFRRISFDSAVDMLSSRRTSGDKSRSFLH